MKSAPVALALLLGVQAQRQKDKDHPKPFFRADKVEEKCTNKAVEEAYGAYTAAVAVQKPKIGELPALEALVTAAIAAKNVKVAEVVEYEKAGSDFRTNLAADDALDRTELLTRTDLVNAKFAQTAAIAALATAQSNFDAKKALYDAAKVKLNGPAGDNQTDKDADCVRVGLKAGCIGLTQSLIDETSHQSTEQTSTDALKGDLDTKKDAYDNASTGKLKLFNDSDTIYQGHVTAYNNKLAEKDGALKTAMDAAKKVWDDSKLLYDNQVKLVGTAQYTLEKNTVDAGAANVDITALGAGSATSTAVLGTALAKKEKALADIVAGNTLNTASTYTDWKVQADKMVQTFAARKKCIDDETQAYCYGLVDDNAAYSGGTVSWSGGTADKLCNASNSFATETTVTDAACKTACNAIAVYWGTGVAAPAGGQAGAGNNCTGYQWVADGTKCKLVYDALPTDGMGGASGDKCYVRTKSKLSFDYETAKAAAATLETNWYAKYDSTDKWKLSTSGELTAYTDALKAVDVAQVAYNNARQIEFRYKWVSERDGDATYKKCTSPKVPTWVITYATAGTITKDEQVADPTWSCTDPNSGGSDTGTDTDGLYKVAKAAYDAAVIQCDSSQVGLAKTMTDYEPTWTQFKVQKEYAKTQYDEAQTAYDNQKAEQDRQDSLVTQITTEKAAAATLLASLDTEVGVTVTTAGLQKILTDAGTAKTAADTAVTDAQAAYDTAKTAGVDHHDAAGYAGRVTDALASLQALRDEANNLNAALVTARENVAAKKLEIATAQDDIDAADDAHEVALVACREEKYNTYRTTLDDAEKARAKTLQDIKEKMAKEAKDAPKAGSGVKDARCEKARSNGDSRVRAACGEGLCCGAAKGSVGGAIMTIETCQPNETKKFTYKPPRAAMELDDDPADEKEWDFACIAGAARVAAAATALATSAYLMA